MLLQELGPNFLGRKVINFSVEDLKFFIWILFGKLDVVLNLGDLVIIRLVAGVGIIRVSLATRTLPRSDALTLSITRTSTMCVSSTFSSKLSVVRKTVIILVAIIGALIRNSFEFLTLKFSSVREILVGDRSVRKSFCGVSLSVGCFKSTAELSMAIELQVRLIIVLTVAFHITYINLPKHVLDLISVII